VELGKRSIIIFISCYPVLTEPQKAIIAETNNGTELSGSRSEKIVGGFEVYSENGDQVDIVLTKFDLFNPKYTQVYFSSGKYIHFKIIQLKRTSLFTFEVVDYYYASTKMSFEEAKSIAQKYDLSKENPDPENIRVSPPPSSQPAPSGFKDPRENLSPKEQVKTFLTFIKKHWNEEATQSMLKKDYGKTFSSFEEFRNYPKVIEQYGTVEELGI